MVVGFDSTEEPTPIRLVPKGKMLAEGEVYETQSEEIRCWERVEIGGEVMVVPMGIGSL